MHTDTHFCIRILILATVWQLLLWVASAYFIFVEYALKWLLFADRFLSNFYTNRKFRSWHCAGRAAISRNQHCTRKRVWSQVCVGALRNDDWWSAKSNRPNWLAISNFVSGRLRPVQNAKFNADDNWQRRVGEQLGTRPLQPSVTNAQVISQRRNADWTQNIQRETKW